MKKNQSICQTDQYGNKCWYLNNLIHREDGPAYEGVVGTKVWYLNNRCHRTDGPAIEWFDGHKEWFYHGEQIDCSSQKEFERLINLKALW